MPWENNSGNGGGSRGPWGQPPKGDNGRGQGPRGPGGGGEPPDLEDLLQASRQRLKRAFPRGGGDGGRRGRGPKMDGRFAGLIGFGLLALWLFSGIYMVDADEHGVVTTFGKFDKVTTSGLNWHIPAPIQGVKIEKVTTSRELFIPGNSTQRNSTLGEGLMLTGDKNIVDVEISVQWQIKPGVIGANENERPPVAQFVFNIHEPDQLVRTVGEASIREVVGRNTLDFVQTTGRANVVEDTKALMQATLDAQNAGIEIRAVNLQKSEPPTAEVNEAFLDVEAARQDQQQFINNARAFANSVVPQARGEAQQILESARAYSAQVTAEARGQAERFNAIFEEYEKAPEVTRQRMYLETVESVLGDMNKIIIEDNAGSGVVPYLPLNELQRRGGSQ